MENKFIGAWELVEFKMETMGVSFHPFSKEAHGILIYAPEKKMSVNMVDPRRKVFKGAAKGVGLGTIKEMGEAFKGCAAYYGDYKIDEEKQCITHKVKGSISPNEIGIDMVRYYTFSDDLLTLRTAPMKVLFLDLVGTVIWRRIE